jgi:hypothetical protein
MKTKPPAKSIISASRRTDIPAFYSDWFMNRVAEGLCEIRNPFGGQIYRVSLNPEDSPVIFFWTRNPEPMFEHLPRLLELGFHIFFHFTIIHYPRALEEHSPDLAQSIRRCIRLSELLGSSHIIWRYDPIIFSSITPPEYHFEKFAGIAAQLKGSTHRCIFSFVDYYRKTRRRLDALSESAGIVFSDPSPAERLEFATGFSRIAEDSGINLHACCEEELLGPGILKAHCIGLDILNENGLALDLKARAKPVREGCGCVESYDIGAYDSCLFGCKYCYATQSHAAAVARNAKHDPKSRILIS